MKSAGPEASARDKLAVATIAEYAKSEEQWGELYQYVTTPPKKPEDFIPPADPKYCLACATLLHVIRNFAEAALEPETFNATGELGEWRFISVEDQNEEDPTDWVAKADPDRTVLNQSGKLNAGKLTGHTQMKTDQFVYKDPLTSIQVISPANWA
jgi:hypothetical protein